MYYTQILSIDWGSGVFEKIRNAKKFGGDFDEFKTACFEIAGLVPNHRDCGSLLAAIGEIWPEVYDAIPEDLGKNALQDVYFMLRLLGVKFDEEKFLRDSHFRRR